MHNRVLYLTSAMLLVAACWVSAQGQRPGSMPPMGPPPMGPPPAMMLLMQKVVVEDLKLTADRRKKIGEQWAREQQSMQKKFGQPPDKMGEKMQEAAKESEKALAGIFTADQAKRFKEISLQQQGAQALNQPDVGKEAGLSDEQQSKVKEICESARNDQAKLFQGRPGTPDAMRNSMDKINKATTDKIVEILTAEQKTQWEKMKGKPLKGLQAMPALPGPPR